MSTRASYFVTAGFLARLLTACGGGTSSDGDAGPDAPAPQECAANTTACSGSDLVVCGPNGISTSVKHCPLGCYEAFDADDHCLRVSTHNGVSSYLTQAATIAPVELADGTTIDTDSGAVFAADGKPLTITTTIKERSLSSGPAIRIFPARSFVLHDVRIRGSLAVAFVASEKVDIRGLLDASADAGQPGPGAATEDSCSVVNYGELSCERKPIQNVGDITQILSCPGTAGGGGGGSFSGAGGHDASADGVRSDGGVGPRIAYPFPLEGGCHGGSIAMNGDPNTRGGGGGGAIQIIAGQEIRLSSMGGDVGTIHVGGGGGHAATLGWKESDGKNPAVHTAGGGGGGGTILLESVEVVLETGTRLLAAGGGGGGWGPCDARGADASTDGTMSVGGRCPDGTPHKRGGDGAISGDGHPGADFGTGPAVAGGGGVGRIRIHTKDGLYTASGPVIQGDLKTGPVAR